MDLLSGLMWMTALVGERFVFCLSAVLTGERLSPCRCLRGEELREFFVSSCLSFS